MATSDGGTFADPHRIVGGGASDTTLPALVIALANYLTTH